MFFFRMMYNVTCLNIKRNITELNHIFVLFDMHQDVLSSRTGGSDGIPTGFYDRFPPPAHPCNTIYFIVNIFVLFLLDLWLLSKVPAGDNWFVAYVNIINFRESIIFLFK
jgi:hypothetical protein